MASEWFLQINGRDYGPYAAAQLKQYADEGRIQPQTLIRRGETGTWTAASQIPGLLGSAPAAAAQAPEGDEDVASETQGMSSTTLLLLVGGGGLAALLLLVVVISMFYFLGRGSSPVADKSPAQVNAEAQAEIGDKGSSETTKRPEKPSEIVLNIPDFDPKSLSPDDKKFYDEGVRQGRSIATRELAEFRKTNRSKEQFVKDGLRQRDTAIFVEVKNGGTNTEDALKTFGRRDGWKEQVRKAGFPVP